MTNGSLVHIKLYKKVSENITLYYLPHIPHPTLSSGQPRQGNPPAREAQVPHRPTEQSRKISKNMVKL